MIEEKLSYEEEESVRELFNAERVMYQELRYPGKLRGHVNIHLEEKTESLFKHAKVLIGLAGIAAVLLVVASIVLVSMAGHKKKQTIPVTTIPSQSQVVTSRTNPLPSSKIASNSSTNESDKKETGPRKLIWSVNGVFRDRSVTLAGGKQLRELGVVTIYPKISLTRLSKGRGIKMSLLGVKKHGDVIRIWGLNKKSNTTLRSKNN